MSDKKIIPHSVEDVAARNGLSRASIYKEMNDGSLDYMKVGRRRVIPEEAEAAWKKAKMQGGGK